MGSWGRVWKLKCKWSWGWEMGGSVPQTAQDQDIGMTEVVWGLELPAAFVCVCR